MLQCILAVKVLRVYLKQDTLYSKNILRVNSSEREYFESAEI